MTEIKNRPLAFCSRCVMRTPHRFERIAVNRRLTSRAVCLACQQDARAGTTSQDLSVGVLLRPVLAGE